MDVEKIKQLREELGAGVMDAKKALEAADGDVEKAKQALMEKGIAKAEKRSDRETNAGVIYSYIHNNQVGVLLELNCETDFVAKTDEYSELAHELALQIAAMAPENVEAALEQDYIKDTKKTIDELIKEVSAKTGENVTLSRFTRYALGE